MTDVSSIYKQELEEEIIAELAEATKRSLEEAMDVYYRSRLSRQISDGCYGIEYLSAPYLVQVQLNSETISFEFPEADLYKIRVFSYHQDATWRFRSSRR